MMLVDFFNKRLKRMVLLDIKLAQGAALFVGLVVAKVFPQVLTVSVWWLAALAVLLWIRPIWVILRRE